MGATEFFAIGDGADMAQAFRDAVERARGQYGDDGYTGSVAEKDGTPLVVRDTPMTEGDARTLAYRLVDGRDARVIDPWGPACAIPIGDGARSTVGCSSGWPNVDQFNEKGNCVNLLEAITVVVREMRVGHSDLSVHEAIDDARTIVDISDVVGNGDEVVAAFRVVKGHPGGVDFDRAVETVCASEMTLTEAVTLVVFDRRKSHPHFSATEAIVNAKATVERDDAVSVGTDTGNAYVAVLDADDDALAEAVHDYARAMPDRSSGRLSPMAQDVVMHARDVQGNGVWTVDTDDETLDELERHGLVAVVVSADGTCYHALTDKGEYARMLIPIL